MYRPSNTCEVYLCDESKNIISSIEIGMNAVLKVAEYVESGALGAFSVEKSFSNNYDIVFEDAGLLEFLDRYFSGAVSDELRNKIKRGGKYVVVAYDMS